MFGSFYGFGIDAYYLILIIPAAILSLYAQMKVSSTFSKYNTIENSRRMTGAEVARRILDQNGLSNVSIEHVRGNLSDHYDPRSRILRLSDSVYNSYSVAALGVAAHECGHAIQHANAYVPLKMRSAVFPAVRISSAAAMPLIILGLIVNRPSLLIAGIILFSAVVVFQLITLPVEFNASARALKILEGSYFLDSYELPGAKKVLRAAALTYVASAIMAVAQLLRLLLIANNRRR